MKTALKFLVAHSGDGDGEDLEGLNPTFWQADAPPDTPGAANTPSQLWSGVVTSTSFVWSTKLSASAANVRLVVSKQPDLSVPFYYKVPVASANGQAKDIVQGLVPDTKYYWGLLVDGVLKDATLGEFRTLPSSEAFSYRFTVGSCTENSNAASFSGMAALDPLFFLQTGDIHYQDTNSTNIADHLTAMDNIFGNATIAEFYRTVPNAHVWSDHDYCGAALDMNAAGKSAAQAAYRAKVPHVSLEVAGGIYHSFKIGRVIYVMLDTHSFRSPTGDTDGPSKTVIGTTQKTWLKNLLIDGDNQNCIFAIITPEPWNGTDTDSWGNYSTERAELADYIVNNGLQNRVFMLSGDAHCVALDSGNNMRGAFPVFQAAPLGASANSTKGIVADLGPFTTALQQYGVVDVTDAGGDVIELRFRAFTGAGASILDKTYYLSPTAPTVTGTTFQVDANANATSLAMDVSAPAGKRLLLLVALDKASGTINVPTDDGTGTWTLVGTKHEAGTGISGALFTKVAAGNETQITATWTNSVRCTLTLVQLANADAPDQFGMSTTQASTIGRTTGLITAGGQTAEAGELALAFMFADSIHSTDAATAYGWTDDFVNTANFNFGSLTTISDGAPPILVGRKLLPTVQTPSTTGSWTGDTEEEAMGILVTMLIGDPVLTITGSPVTRANINETYGGFSVSAYNGVEPLTFSLVGDWPTGITIDPNTGVVSGTPTESGDFINLNIQVTDAEMNTAQLTPSFDLLVFNGPNLLAGLTWTAGASTIASEDADFVRATRNGANPRAYWHVVTGLVIGATYRLGPNTIYKRNSTNVVMRVADTTAIGTDGPYDSGLLTADTLIDTTFVADATSYYVGLVGVNTLNTHYVEADKDFSLTYVSGP